MLAKNAKQIEALEKTIEELERELYRYRFARKRTFKSYAIAVRCCVKIFRALRSGNYASLGSLGYRLTAFQGMKRNTILTNDLRSLSQRYQNLVTKNANLLQENDELRQQIQNLEELLRQKQLEYDELYERYQQSQESINQLQALLQHTKDQLEYLRKELEAERELLNSKFAGDFQALIIRIKIFGYLQRNLAKQFYSSFIKAKGIIEMMDLPLEIKHLYRDIALMNDDEAFGIVAPVMDETLIEKAKINKPRKANIVTSVGNFGDGGSIFEAPSRAASVMRGSMGTSDQVSNVIDAAEDGGHVADVVRNSVSMQQQNQPHRKRMSRQLQLPNPSSINSTKTGSISSGTPLTSRKSMRQSDGSIRQNLPYRVSALQHPSKYKKDYKAIFRNFGNRYISTLKYLKSEYPFNLLMDLTFWMKWIRFGMTSRDKVKSTKVLMEVKKSMLLEAEEKEKEKEKKEGQDGEEKKQEETSKEEKKDNEEKKSSETSTPNTAATKTPQNQQLEDLKNSLTNQSLESIQSNVPEFMIQTFFESDSSRVQFFADLLLQDISCLQSLVYHMKLHLQYYKKKMILFKDLEIEYNDLFKRFKKMESTMEQNTAIKTKRQQMMKARTSNAHLLNKDVNSYLQNVMKAIDSVKEQFGGLYPGDSTGSVSQGVGKSTSAPISSPASRRSMAGSDTPSPAKHFMATRSSLALGGSIGLASERHSPTSSGKSLTNSEPSSAKSKKKFFPSFEEAEKEAIPRIEEHHDEIEDHEEALQEHNHRKRKGKKVKQIKHDEEDNKESHTETSPDRKGKRRKSKKPLGKEKKQAENNEKDETDENENADTIKEKAPGQKSISFKAYEEQLPEDALNPTVEGSIDKKPPSTPPSRLRKGFSLGRLKIASISDPAFDLDPKKEETASNDEGGIEGRETSEDLALDNSDSKVETDDNENDDDYEDSRENLSSEEEESESQPSEARTRESSLEEIIRDEEEVLSRKESKEDVPTHMSKVGSIETQKDPLKTRESSSHQKDQNQSGGDDRRMKKKVSIVEPPPVSSANSVVKNPSDDLPNASILTNSNKSTTPNIPPPLTSFSENKFETSTTGDMEGGGINLTARSGRSHQRSFFSGADQSLTSTSNSFSTMRTSAPPSRTTSLMIRQTSNSKLTQIQDEIEEEDDDDFYDEDDNEFDEEEQEEAEEEEDEEEDKEKENANFMNELELAQQEALAFMQRENELQSQISSLKDENQSLLDSIEQLSEQLEKLRHQQDLMNEEIYDLKHDLHTLTLSYDEISHENSLLREIVQNEYKYHHEKVNKLFDSLQDSIKRKEEERRLQQRRNKRNQGTQITCSVCAIREYFDENYEKKPSEAVKTSLTNSRPHSPHQIKNLYTRDDDETIAEFDKTMKKAFDGEEKVLIPRFQKFDHEAANERSKRLHELQGNINYESYKNQKPFEELENYEFLEGNEIPFVDKILQILEKQNPDQNYSRPSTGKEKRFTMNTMITQTEEDSPVILSTDQPIRTSTNKGVIYFRESNPSAGKVLKKTKDYRMKTPISNIEIVRDFPPTKTPIANDALPRMNSAQIGTSTLKDAAATSEQYEKSKNVLKYARSLMSHTPTGLYSAANPNPVTAATSTNAANSAVLGISRPLSAIALNQGSSSSSLQPLLQQQNTVSPHVSMLQPPAPHHIEFPTNVNGNILNTGQNRQRPSSAIAYSTNKERINQSNATMENFDPHQRNQHQTQFQESSKFRKIKQMPATTSQSPLINNPMIFNQTIAYQPDNRQDREDFQNYQQKLLTKEKDQETLANTAAFLQGRQLYDRVLASEYVKQLKEEERRTFANPNRAMSTSQLPTSQFVEGITGIDVGELRTSHSERMIPSGNNSLMKAINITLNRPPSATTTSTSSRPLSSSLQRKSNASSNPMTALHRNKSKLSYQFSDDADSINDFIEEDQED